MTLGASVREIRGGWTNFTKSFCHELDEFNEFFCISIRPIRAIRGGLLAHDAFLLQGLSAKVQDDCKFQAGRCQVVMRLGFMRRANG